MNKHNVFNIYQKDNKTAWVNTINANTNYLLTKEADGDVEFLRDSLGRHVAVPRPHDVLARHTWLALHLVLYTWLVMYTWLVLCTWLVLHHVVSTVHVVGTAPFGQHCTRVTIITWMSRPWLSPSQDRHAPIFSHCLLEPEPCNNISTYLYHYL